MDGSAVPAPRAELKNIHKCECCLSICKAGDLTCGVLSLRAAGAGGWGPLERLLATWARYKSGLWSLCYQAQLGSAPPCPSPPGGQRLCCTAPVGPQYLDWTDRGPAGAEAVSL